MRVHTRRLLDVTPSRDGERPFVAAASGLCEAYGQLFVVADDEHSLATFSAQSDAPGMRHPLLLSDARDYSPLPKAHKPDLEALCVLPGGALLALPSGSSPARHLGAVITLHAGVPMGHPRQLDFAPLFERLAQETRSVNLEGAAVVGHHLWLAQRGNKVTPNALFEIDLAAVNGSEVPASAFRRAVKLSLGELDGIPFTPTDLHPLPDGRLIVSAVCEDTSDSYLDGTCVGAAVAILEPGQPPDSFERLDPTFKIEGVIARSGSILWMVCDADDPQRPAPLLEGKLGEG